MRMRKTLPVIGLCLAAAWTLTACGDAARQAKSEFDKQLLGSWHVTRAQTSLILSIEPEQKVLVLWIREGSHSMERTSWKPFHGGILINSIPRLRLWRGREGNANELRAELESIAELDVDANKLFCDHFFMRRIPYREQPPSFRDRPVPPRWKQATLSDEWNATAGRKPLDANIRQTGETGGEKP